MSTVDKKEVFRWLDQVRESGRINMFAAPPYIADFFDIPLKEAIALFSEWAENFGKKEQTND